ncbi:hypothetical protein NECAME_03535 [Necator americanus]|uniref:EXTL2, alpha-1,4-N-acetylhexosaminyltransferase n=1 Tax=Necator americanus TaxID=51031 RepID=W2T5B4_NECAM|nr:hypothetical protein NECAME_03535 [Necator americanus]ETN76162.1 hypothetical protein NECAME_03535 [Necator americanus]
MKGLLPIRNGYRHAEEWRSSSGAAVFEKLLKLFSLRNVAFVMFLSIYTLFVLLLRGGFPLDDSTFRREKSKVVVRNIYDDYDVGCNGYSMDFRISEQQRILRSVRSELTDSSAKLREVTTVYEDLTKKIPEKQLELIAITDEIESARRTLRELQDRRNVRVFLPHKPVHYADVVPTTNINHSPFSMLTWETAVDFSRCSITSFMPLYIIDHIELSSSMSGFKKELLSQGNIVQDPNSACLSFILTNAPLNSSLKLPDSGRNTVVVNFGDPFSVPESFSVIMVQQLSYTHLARPVDFNLFLDVPEYSISSWKEMYTLLPYSRKYLLFILVAPEGKETPPLLFNDLDRLSISAESSGDSLKILNCSGNSDGVHCPGLNEMETIMRESTFCVSLSPNHYCRFFWSSLRTGCIPVVTSIDFPLPFEDHIDWRLASLRIPLARFPELYFIVRSFEMAEVLEMRRMGRIFFERYLGDQRAIVKALLASLREKIGIPSPPEVATKVTSSFFFTPYRLYFYLLKHAVPLFNNSFTAPILTPINVPPIDDEYLGKSFPCGPLEGPVDSGSFLHNFSSLYMYSYLSWNIIGRPGKSIEFLEQSVDPPTESEFYPDSSVGFRPVEPGSGVEFSRALGGNRAREQFTVVLLTYNRDAVLAASLERLHRLPYLNKVIVIWNNVAREPLGAWPRLHVPVEFIKVAKNSLNNRFVPWDRITTEAVLSLDDDIDLKQHEIVFAFRCNGTAYAGGDSRIGLCVMSIILS